MAYDPLDDKYSVHRIDQKSTDPLWDAKTKEEQFEAKKELIETTEDDGIYAAIIVQREKHRILGLTKDLADLAYYRCTGTDIPIK